MSNKKYFWLKLQRDFFKRHDSMIIESMDNGKDYMLFYLKLLVESIDHEGQLRFSDTVPYNEKMLATITNTNIDIVRTAVKVFSELGMVEILDDGTIYMNQIEKMIGSETNKAESMRKLRADRKEVTMLPNVTERYTELDIDIEKDKELDINTEPHKQIAIEFYKHYAEKKGIMLSPSEKDYLTAKRIYDKLPDIDYVLKLIPIFFDDSYGFWFNKDKAYYFSSFDGNLQTLISAESGSYKKNDGHKETSAEILARMNSA